MGTPRISLAILCRGDFIPLGMNMETIINSEKAKSAIAFAAENSILLEENDAEKFAGKNIVIMLSNMPEESANIDALQKDIALEFCGIGIEIRINGCRKIQMKDGSEVLKLFFRAVRRVSIANIIQHEPFYRVSTERLSEHGLGNRNILEKLKIDVFSCIGELADFGYQREMWAANCSNKQNFSVLIDAIIYNANSMLQESAFNAEELHDLMSELNVVRRWQAVADKLNNELLINKTQYEMNKKVRDEMAKTQREYMLRSQMEKLEDELAKMHPEETSDARLKNLKNSIESAGMPEHALSVARKEFSRLKLINPASLEFNVAFDYLNLLAGVPWHKRTEDNLSPANTQKILDEDHYDLEKVKKRIVEYVAIRKLNPGKKGPILCLVGPPGVGKTSIGQSLGRALGRVLVRKSLGGVRDEAEIRGHRRTYVGALPGFIIQYMKKAGVVNPIFVLDEVDKMASDFRGDPASALLEVLDPEQNMNFSDHYLGVDYDLSQVMFICTANYLPGIPPTLLDRMEVIELPGYIREQKLEIAKRFLVPKQLKETGVWDYRGREFFTDDALMRIIANYTSEAGVRNLEREIVRICSDTAIKIVSSRPYKKQIFGDDLPGILGTVKYLEDSGGDIDMPGVVTGLAVNAIEGCALTIGSCKMLGKGKLEFTGGLKDVMQESVNVAFTCAKRYLTEHGMNLDFLKKIDIHVQFENNAIPKDGPSAGAAIALNLISLLTERKVRPDLALTGEITLREGGKILPVGGIKSKILAAERAGKKVVFIPEGNKKDLPDIPDNVKQKLDIRLAKNLKEIVDFALL